MALNESIEAMSFRLAENKRRSVEALTAVGISRKKAVRMFYEAAVMDEHDPKLTPTYRWIKDGVIVEWSL